MTAKGNELRGLTKSELQSTSQRIACTNKMSWPLFSGLSWVWSTTVFWTQENHYTWEVFRCTLRPNIHCWHWLAERIHLLSTKMSNFVSHNQSFRIWMKDCSDGSTIGHMQCSYRVIKPVPRTYKEYLTTPGDQAFFSAFFEYLNMYSCMLLPTHT